MIKYIWDIMTFKFEDGADSLDKSATIVYGISIWIGLLGLTGRLLMAILFNR